jgi:parallel beta-helix repeat protein
MSHLRVLFLLAAGLLLGAQPMFATTVVVGTCKPSLPSYPSISQAVSSVPPGSTVEVCPGNYAEQVIISQPLTLKGLSSGNSSQAGITIPSGGLTAVSGLLTNLAAQVEVTAGPVNITNMILDGSGGGNSCSSFLVGIYYASGSSGTVSGSTVRNEINSGCGFGIWAENGAGTNESVTLEDNSIHAMDDIAIIAFSNQSSPTLTATIKGNYIESGGGEGIFFGFAGTIAGSVTGNFVTSNGGCGQFCSVFESEGGIGSIGISDSAPSTTISGNTVTGYQLGIVANGAGTTVTSNKILNSTAEGIALGASGLTVQSNTIANSSYVGIEFGCQTGNTVARNTIIEAAIGLDRVPSGFLGANIFDTVFTNSTGGC